MVEKGAIIKSSIFLIEYAKVWTWIYPMLSGFLRYK